MKRFAAGFLSLAAVSIGVLSIGVLSLEMLPARAGADEGMWTFNNPPREQVKQKYGFSMSDEWLHHVQLSSARIAGGCSASFVSASGLVMTNHHCAHSCIQQLSTKEKDFVQTGFYAKAESDEVKCPEIEINQLAEISDVTERIGKATAGLDGQKQNEARKSEMSKIEKECASSDAVRCDVVELYHGGRYDLYKYNRFQDVRLVFAPEFQMAFFGGDPDNFNFPRYDLDVSFLRVYQNGKPAAMKDFFKWSAGGAKEGEVTFVTGNPGGTDRQLSIAELEYQRDVALPARMMRLAELRGVITEYQHRSAEAKRVSEHDLFGIENSFKALRGRFEALLDKPFFDSKIAEEKQLRAKLAESPEKLKKFGGAWDAIAKAEMELRKIRKPLQFMEQGGSFYGDLATIARTEVRGAEERAKPNDKRFREYRDTALPEITQRLFSTAPISDEFEILKLTFSLTKLREELGADHPFVKKVLGKDSPEDLATRLVKGTRLKDMAVRKALWEGGKQAVDASDDPLVKLFKLVDPDARAIRKRYEEEIEAVQKRNNELIAKSRFEAMGASTYPDATFTLRLSYGSVAGYEENGRHIQPITDFRGAFDRATGRPPFDLPQSWLAAKSKLNLQTPFDFCTTNDIIGGNSGSPVINKNGEVVGLIFDGNIQSLGGDYGYDGAVNRAVAVESTALLEALSKVYGADRIVSEIVPAGAGKQGNKKMTKR